MRSRLEDYAILLLVWTILTVPSLQHSSLWDVDEGVNAEAAREMAEADSWIVPTFNYELRTAKPVLLYWLQRLCYAAFGVAEWTARLPSALSCGLAVLLSYELGRHMFGRRTGLWSGIILASMVQWVVLAHAATPDGPLLACTTLALATFWHGHWASGRAWWLPTAAACGLAVLAKGPVGVVLPGLVIVSYFAWNREWRRLWDRRLLAAAGVFLLVAGPWYALVSSETRGQWIKSFIGRENLQRFAQPMEGHRGPWFYYLLVLPVMAAPWSIWLWPTLQAAIRNSRRRTGTPEHAKRQQEEPLTPEQLLPQSLAIEKSFQQPLNFEISLQPTLPAGPLVEPASEEAVRAYRFLLCWMGAYLLVFSAAATKLPNYIFPLYPALAILTARWLVAWAEGRTATGRWVMPVAAGLLTLIGILTGLGLWLGDRFVPGLHAAAAIGGIPLLGAIALLVAIRQQRPIWALRAVGLTAVTFLAVAVTVVPPILDQHRAPRPLVVASGVADPHRDLRLATAGWFAPSVVFYSGRETARLETPAALAEFLAVPTPAYVFLPEPLYQQWAATVPLPPHAAIARHFDLLKGCPILAITNQVEPAAAPAAGTTATISLQ